MIERESDERLLENGHKRFGQIVGQRPQPFAESRAKNESLRDSVHPETRFGGGGKNRLARIVRRYFFK